MSLYKYATATPKERDRVMDLCIFSGVVKWGREGWVECFLYFDGDIRGRANERGSVEGIGPLRI